MTRQLYPSTIFDRKPILVERYSVKKAKGESKSYEITEINIFMYIYIYSLGDRRRGGGGEEGGVKKRRGQSGMGKFFRSKDSKRTWPIRQSFHSIENYIIKYIVIIYIDREGEEGTLRKPSMWSKERFSSIRRTTRSMGYLVPCCASEPTMRTRRRRDSKERRGIVRWQLDPERKIGE